MNTARILSSAALALAAAGLANAVEITEFVPEAPSALSREAVRAEALAANQAKALRYDAAGPAVVPMSSRSRDEVREDAAQSRMRGAAALRDDAAMRDVVGGM